MNETRQLETEFGAGPNTVLGTMLAGTWDSAAFRRLCALLRTACLDCEAEVQVAKWMAAGFHEIEVSIDRYLPPALGLDADFANAVKEHLMFMACWFFSGMCPFESPQHLVAELDQLLDKAPDKQR